MKHFFRFFFVGTFLTCCFFFSSCGQTFNNLSGVNLTNQESVDNNTIYLTDIVGENDLITQIEFSPGRNKGVTKTANEMTFYMYNKGGDSLSVWDVSLSKKTGEEVKVSQRKINEKIYKQELKTNLKENALLFKDIDFSHIAQYVNDGGSQVLELGKESDDPIFFSGIGKYTITLNKDPQKIKHEFIIESKDTTKSSRNMHVFYEYPFVVEAGKVVMKKK